MYLEYHTTVGETCVDGEEHRRDNQGIRCEVVWRLGEGHTHGIGVGAVELILSEYEPSEGADSVHTYGVLDVAIGKAGHRHIVAARLYRLNS